nr:NAD(P)-binding protein [Gammaproteobacteria bacterium]
MVGSVPDPFATSSTARTDTGIDRERKYLVIGSGAGGAAAAWRWAESSAHVLLLEKGEPLPLDGSALEPRQPLAYHLRLGIAARPSVDRASRAR